VTEYVIFHKQYDGESMVDLDRDITEAFDSRFNPQSKIITADEYGLFKGTFNVTITWNDDA